MDRPKAELRAAAELVLAEHRRLLLAAHHLTRLQELKLAESDEFNAFVESFLLHYRNLLDFLEPRGTARPGDVQAYQFLVRRRHLKVPVQYRDAIDKRLSHITVHRLGVMPTSKAWNPRQMLREFEESWGRFIAALGENSPDRVPWFESHTADPPNITARMVTTKLLQSASTSPPGRVTMHTFKSEGANGEARPGESA
ncbi:MAG: hypothetical protein ABIJ48_01715 [Actinomycetota bacterium]